MSAFGSAVNENPFLLDGTNFNGTGNGVARTEPGIDFIQEIQSSPSGHRPNTATFRAPSSTSSPGREATAFCLTPRTMGRPPA